MELAILRFQVHEQCQYWSVICHLAPSGRKRPADFVLTVRLLQNDIKEIGDFIARVPGSSNGHIDRGLPDEPDGYSDGV